MRFPTIADKESSLVTVTSGRMSTILFCGFAFLGSDALSQPRATPMSAMQTYAYHDSIAAASRKSGDWARYRTEVVLLDSLLNGHPNVRVVLARIYGRLGDTASAYSSLRDFAAMGLNRDLVADSGLAMLRGTPSWDAVIARVKTNADPVGTVARVFELPDSEFVAEDITYDAVGKRFLVSSVRRSKIVAVTPTGVVSGVAGPIAQGWGMLAVAVDSTRKILWATAEAVPLVVGYDSTQEGRATVLQYDLVRGTLIKRYDLPSDAHHQAGDITVAPNGDLFVADGDTGALYVIRQGKALEVLVAPGEFRSPQGSAVASDGTHLYVADYTRGLARVDRVSGKVEWVRHSRDVALNGIDGLTWAGPNTLVAVQNGTNPNRILLIALSDDGSSVRAVSVVAQNNDTITEPTHGVFVGSEYYFIANGGYGSFDDKGRVNKGERVRPPVVMRTGPVTGAR